MGIEWYRDLIICIAGAITCIMTLVVIAAIVYITLVVKSLNKKAKSIMGSVDITASLFDGYSAVIIILAAAALITFIGFTVLGKDKKADREVQK